MGGRYGPLRWMLLLLFLPLLAVACAPAATSATPPADAAPGEAPGQAPTTPPGDSTATPPNNGSTTPPTEQPVAPPDDPWRTAELRDVRSGQTLRVNDLVGNLVVIEPMAIWCTSCRIQQSEAREALAGLDRDDIVYISLGVDPNETEPDLARYADERGYQWHFVVASREVARSLAETFGDQVLSPPSTPKIVIAPDGTAEVGFGIKRAADLEADFSAKLP